AVPLPGPDDSQASCTSSPDERGQDGHHDRSVASTASSNRTAPALSNGSFPLPHLGDWTQDGHPASHSQDATASLVALSHCSAVSYPRAAKPAPPGCPS